MTALLSGVYLWSDYRQRMWKHNMPLVVEQIDHGNNGSQPQAYLKIKYKGSVRYYRGEYITEREFLYEGVGIDT